MRQTSEDILREALGEELEQEISRVPPDEQIRAQHTFSRTFRKKMKKVLENPDLPKAADDAERAQTEPGMRNPGKRKQIRILAACIACFLVVGIVLGSQTEWFSPDSSFSESADTSGASGAAGEEIREPGSGGGDSSVSGVPEESLAEQDETENNLENVTMTVTEAENYSAEILVENGSDEYLWYGDEYSLERLDEETDTWQPVEETAEVAYNDLAYNVYAGGSSRWRADWTKRYGALAPGTYRIVKVLYVGRDGGEDTAHRMTAEFTIGEP